MPTAVQAFLTRAGNSLTPLLAQARAIAADGGCVQTPGFRRRGGGRVCCREPVEKSWYDELSGCRRGRGIAESAPHTSTI